MPQHRVVLTATAERHVRAIVAWWTGKRESAPTLFEDELAAALRQLAALPLVGSVYEGARLPGVRRVRLRRSQFHVYYTIDREKRDVVVRAVWHCARGRAPPL